MSKYGPGGMDISGYGNTGAGFSSPWPHHQPDEAKKYDPEIPYRNVQGSVPDDSYKNAFWIGSPLSLSWFLPADNTYGDSTGVLARAVWTSPIFDLRPDLKGAMGAVPEAVPIRGKSGSYGSGITLVTQLVGIENFTDEAEVYGLVYGHPYAAQEIRRSSYRQDVSDDVFDAIGTGETIFPIVTFSPPTGLRFWRVALVFDLFTGTPVTAPTNVLVCACCL